MLGIRGDSFQGELPGRDREWFIANGRGGYAALSLMGATTRSFHGLLVGALTGPDDRVMAVGQFDAWAEADGQRYPLVTPEYRGVPTPDFAATVEETGIEGRMAVTRWRLGDARLEQRIWTEHGRNTTYVQFTMLAGSARIHVAPLLTLRNLYAHTYGFAHWRFGRWEVPDGVALQAFLDAPPVLLLTVPAAPLQGNATWYWHLYRHWEARRGYPAEEDLYCPGAWDVQLTADESFTVILSLEAPEAIDRDVAASRARFAERTAELVQQTGRDFSYDPFARQLMLAADAMVIAGPQGVGVLSGYPWQGSLTREVLIALPGLALATGRPDVAAAVLRALAGRFHDGLLPDAVFGLGWDGYSNADTGLWWFAALDAYMQATGDLGLLREVYPAAESAFRALTGVGGRPSRLRMDRDGLLAFAPESGLATWMNAHVNGAPVTPRAGKPVELNALWHHAVQALERWGERIGRRIQGLPQLAGRIRASFNQRYWYPAGNHLYDVVDGPGGDDASLRPNQVLALSLPDAVLDPERHAAVFGAVTAQLLTPMGLRTLSPHDPRYRGYYEGDAGWRDGAAHQGSVWPWLMGPYMDAALRTGSDPLLLKLLFTGLHTDLARGALGTLGEVYDGTEPHRGGGAPVSAASVAEVLRGWLRVQDSLV